MNHMDEKRAAQLLGSPERRVAFRDIEVRAAGENTYKVRGYACVTEFAYDVYGGAERGGWSETVKRGAFDTTLASNPDVCFLLNHEGAPLARTRSGTLQLRADNTGLESEAEVDRRDPEGQALEIKMERGDLDQMSFGFRVTRQMWNEDYTERDITEVNLDNGDVSIVNWPANPATSMSLVSARSALAVLGEMEMSELRGELRGVEPAQLRAAQARLAELVEHLDAAAAKAPRTVEVDVVPVVRDLDTGTLTALGRSLFGALLGESSDERLDNLVANLRTMSAPAAMVVTSEGTLSFNAPNIPTPEGREEEDDEAEEHSLIGPSTVLKDAVDSTIVAEFERSADPTTETAIPSRSVRSIARLRELHGI